MIERILHFSLHHRYLIALLTAAVAAMGIYSLKSLPIDAVPDITNNQVQINTVATALSPVEIEKQVTFPVETALAGIPGLESTRSISRNGFSQVTAIFNDDVDIYFARNQVNERLAEARESLPVGADPRITRAGQILRSTKLDELPQLWDVLRGAMSLVGPRPELPRYVEFYPADLRDRVLAVRPGITDPASLAFSDEAALLAEAADPEREYREVVLPAKLRLSAAYAAHAGLTNDLKLIFATLARVARG